MIDESLIWHRFVTPGLSLTDRLSVEIEQDDNEDFTIMEQAAQITWTVVQVNPNSLELDIKLSHPEHFTLGFERYLIVKLKFSDFEPGWNDNEPLIRVRVPTQKIQTASPAVAAKVDTAADATQTATVATLTGNILLSASMSQVWGMINGLQLVTQLPLFHVAFP